MESWDDIVLPEGGISLIDQPAPGFGHGTTDAMDWEGQGPVGPGRGRGMLREGSFELDEMDSSFDTVSSGSSGKQATLKASTLKHGAGRDGTQQDPTAITPAVLAVLASGVKGTVTRLEPKRRVLSPKQAAIDWDVDIEMPDRALQGIPAGTGGGRQDGGQQGGTLRLKPRPAVALDDVDFGDEEEQVTKTLPPTSPFARKTMPGSTHSSPRFGVSPSQRRVLNREPDPPPEDLTDFFDLPMGLSRVSLAPSLNPTHASFPPSAALAGAAGSRPQSMVSIDELERIREEDDRTLHPPSALPPPPPPSSSHSRLHPGSRYNLRGGSRSQRSGSLRSRPSLTPTLTTDRSSSPFTEPDFDEDEGFFDELEWPPTNPSHHFAPPPSATATMIAKGGNKSSNGKSGLQLWLEERLKSRVQAASPVVTSPLIQSPASDRPAPPMSRTSSEGSKTTTKPRSGSLAPTFGSTTKLPSTTRRNKTVPAYDESVEDGLEITPESLRPDRLRKRTDSLASSNARGPSSVAQQWKVGTGGTKRVPHNAAGLAFPTSPSVSTATAKGSIGGASGAVRHTRASLMRTKSSTKLDVACAPDPPRPTRPSLTAATSTSTIQKRTAPTSTTARPMSMYGRPGQTTTAPAPPQPTTTSRFRTTSLRPSPSSSSLAGDHSQRGGPSPAFDKPGPPTSRPATASGTRGLAPPPPGQDALRRKRSAANLRINPRGSTEPPPSTAESGGSRTGSPPPGIPRRGLTRKQSMPAFRSPVAVESSTQPSLRSSAPNRERPSSRNSGLRSYAEPTKSSILHQQPASVQSTAPAPQRRMKRDLDTAMGVMTSRLTMPTISSRMKSKPSVIHEDPTRPGPSTTTTTSRGSSGSSTPRHVLANAPPPPQQLRRPKRVRQYGDGSELDAFDDLPTSREKERKFMVDVKRPIAGPPTKGAALVGKSSVTVEVKPATPSATTRPSTEPGKARLVARKAEQMRKKERDAAKRPPSKKGLITKMSINAFPRGVKTGEMKWNPLEKRWEGNDQEARLFENTLASSARPALITNPSFQSPAGRGPTHPTKAQPHVVGDMVFDPVAMCWHSRTGDAEEEIDFGDDEGESFDRMSIDEMGAPGGTGASVEGMTWDGPGQRETTMRLKNRASWIGDIAMASSSSTGEGQVDERDEDGAAFWRECVEAEQKHKEETRWWMPKRQSDDEFDRSYLYEIRKLVMEQ